MGPGQEGVRVMGGGTVLALEAGSEDGKCVVQIERVNKRLFT